MPASILLVDDGSVVPVSGEIGARSYDTIEATDVLPLQQNLGHQRAIAIALAYVHDRLAPDVTVVMDRDGEDAPQDVARRSNAFTRSAAGPSSLPSADGGRNSWHSGSSTASTGCCIGS
jgi:hypothetical protein